MSDNPRLFDTAREVPGRAISTEVTLRDVFAGLAMAGIVQVVAMEGGMTDADVAREAYKTADAMLKERLK